MHNARIGLHVVEKGRRVHNALFDRNQPVSQRLEPVPAPGIICTRIETHAGEIEPVFGKKRTVNAVFQDPRQQVQMPALQILHRACKGNVPEFQLIPRAFKRRLQPVNKRTRFIGTDERAAIKQRDLESAGTFRSPGRA